VLSYPLLALGVLAFGIAAEGFSMWGCLREVDKTRGEQSLWQWFRGSRNAELVVIFGEDLAALLGLTIAFIAVLVAWITGNVFYDALGGIGIGVLLLVVAVMVGIEVKALLVGPGCRGSRAQGNDRLPRGAGADREGIELLTLHMGGDVMVAVKAKMREHGSQAALIDAINRIEASFKERFPQTQWTFFEPDVR